MNKIMKRTNRLALKLLVMITAKCTVAIGLGLFGAYVIRVMKEMGLLDLTFISVLSFIALGVFIISTFRLCDVFIKIIGAYWMRNDRM